MTRQEEKQQLRAIVRRLEAALAPEYKGKKAPAPSLIACWPCRNIRKPRRFSASGGTNREIDTRPILEDALAAGKTLCVPLCTEPGHMESARSRT